MYSKLGIEDVLKLVLGKLDWNSWDRDFYFNASDKDGRCQFCDVCLSTVEAGKNEKVDSWNDERLHITYHSSFYLICC